MAVTSRNSRGVLQFDVSPRKQHIISPYYRSNLALECYGARFARPLQRNKRRKRIKQFGGQMRGRFFLLCRIKLDYDAAGYV